MTEQVHRLTGPDALMLHLEDDQTPMHTLKVAVLDTARLCRAITLADLHRLVPEYLGIAPWTTRRFATGRGYGGRPFLVDAPVELEHHLDEVHAPTPDRAGLDAVCADLAERRLDRGRPPWAITLVHGLENGRQALVVRVHHAVADGLAALNTFLALTTDSPEVLPAGERARTASAAATTGADLRRAAHQDRMAARGGLPAAVRAARASRRVSRAYAEKELVPGTLSAPRTSFNRNGGGERVCASGDLDLALVKQVGRASGATLNGVLHAAIAGAMRAEYTARGDRTDVPAVATFGVADDVKTTRTSGNQITAASVYLHVEEADPLVRLERTSRACLHGVALRRERGPALTRALGDLVPRVGPYLRTVFAHRLPRILNNITTANVPGPRTHRFAGPVEVVDWISYAVAVAPAEVNLTVYSYGERMTMGLVATPRSMPDPAAFLRRVAEELDVLAAAVGPVESPEGLLAVS
ncbi:wax ester/triacylglycerol synthase domain-containing protein [Nocardioides acrostichi]|uniref:diacylglycerol O-acyltransferase n=1 Tax=Nocardioides acrostichi TaxID=2784339 RepID=A0A930UYG7_9ACTN|nr:wax ester/triacylglycerol synthase domain-containing protein [Nocardioides acrostichi]MBF4163198.1 DUF1298 domain-containing protein [Nocardioides acrostichi]